jgi:hypothetical protein
LTTPKLSGAYSQQPPVQFSFLKLRWVLQCLNHSTRVSEWKSHQRLLKIRATQFLHTKFAKFLKNKITTYNNLHITPTEPPNLWPP